MVLAITPYEPMAQTTPFTARDNSTYLHKMNGIREKLNELIEWSNLTNLELIDKINLDLDTLQTQWNEELTVTRDEHTAHVETLRTEVIDQLSTPGTDAHNAVVEAAGEVYDPATALLLAGATATRAALDGRYTPRALLDAETGALVTDANSAVSSALSTNLVGKIGVSTSPLNAALADVYATNQDAIGGNIQAVVRKLADDTGTVKILVVGDSTAAQANQWPDVLMPQIQALYPHRTLRKVAWNGGNGSYDAPAVLFGTTDKYIDYYAAAVSGTVPESLWATLDTQIAAVQPDLILVHFGHNYGNTAAAGGQPNDDTMDFVYRERMTRFICEVKMLCPQADIMLTSQNPYLTAGSRYQISNIRAQALRNLCADLGLAYGPILEAYLSKSNPAAYLAGDGLHPLTTGATNGAALAASAILPFFKYSRDVAPSARVPSPLLIPSKNLLTNGDFASFAAPPVLPNWTAYNATLSKDTTNYESVNGYSVKGTAVVQGTVANSQMYASLPIRKVRGQIVTFAARMFVPTGQGSQPGRVNISGDGGLVGISSGTLTNVRDKWIWVFSTCRVPLASTFATVTVTFGAAGPSTIDQCSVDRAVAVLGHLPRDAY